MLNKIMETREVMENGTVYKSRVESETVLRRKCS